MNIDNKTTSDNFIIANHFNRFFMSIAEKLLKKNPKTKKTFSSFLRKKNTKALFLSPTTAEVIKTFNSNKATGPNSIPVIILKEIQKEISEPLSTVINLLFNTGDFPNCLKLAKVIPVYKKGDQQECNNYRPISLLSNINKLIEKLLYNRLYKILNQNKCLFNFQFGFGNHHSTNHALISITEKIRKALGESKFTCGVFLDFQKAFDTVNHKILISKLAYYRIRGLPLHLFQNYFEREEKKTKKAQMCFQ